MFVSTVIHINDIPTLETFVLGYGPERILNLGRFLNSSFLDILLSKIKELNITLRLPIAAFKGFETNDECGSSSSILTPSLLSTLSQLPSAIHKIRSLQRLRIWLDHNEPCSWSMVNERAVLNPLVLLKNENLGVSINLPKLHPKWETPDRHFTDDSVPFVLPIHRRYRQRYHGVLMSDESIHCKHKPDFPELYQLVTEPQICEFNWTHLEQEEQEKRDWKAGLDPVADWERAFEELSEDYALCGLRQI